MKTLHEVMELAKEQSLKMGTTWVVSNGKEHGWTSDNDSAVLLTRGIWDMSGYKILARFDNGVRSGWGMTYRKIDAVS